MQGERRLSMSLYGWIFSLVEAQEVVAYHKAIYNSQKMSTEFSIFNVDDQVFGYA